MGRSAVCSRLAWWSNLLEHTLDLVVAGARVGSSVPVDQSAAGGTWLGENIRDDSIRLLPIFKQQVGGGGRTILLVVSSRQAGYPLVGGFGGLGGLGAVGGRSGGSASKLVGKKAEGGRREQR